MSPWSIGVPLVPAADPAYPLVAVDAFHPVADDNPCPAAGVLPPATADLPPVAPVLDNILPGVTPVLDDTLPGVAPVLDDTLHPAAGVLRGVASALDDTPSPADDLPPTAEQSVP